MFGEGVNSVRRQLLRDTRGWRLPREAQRLRAAKAELLVYFNQLGCQARETRRQENPGVEIRRLGENLQRFRKIRAMLCAGHHAGSQVDRIDG